CYESNNIRRLSVPQGIRRLLQQGGPNRESTEWRDHQENSSIRAHRALSTMATTISDYFVATPSGLDPLGMDPLGDADVLQEAQLLGVQTDAVRGVAGLLFEMRTALQIRQGDTAVLILRGVRDVTWSAPPRPT